MQTYVIAIEVSRKKCIYNPTRKASWKTSTSKTQKEMYTTPNSMIMIFTPNSAMLYNFCK
jgi:hypothetical protein